MHGPVYIAVLSGVPALMKLKAIAGISGDVLSCSRFPNSFRRIFSRSLVRLIETLNHGYSLQINTAPSHLNVLEVITKQNTSTWPLNDSLIASFADIVDVIDKGTQEKYVNMPNMQTS